MKKMRAFLAVFMVLFLGCKEKPEKNVVEVKEKKTTSIKVSSTFEDINGNAVELEDFKGKKVLLNFWATWCRPCIEEMPALLRAQEKLAAENYVFLLASDQSMEKIKAFKEKKKFDFRFLKFNGSLAEMKVNALPATFIYNESGTISDRIDGATEWDSPEVLDHLKAIK
ncbi:TlpA family protein disulfide reductase [Maribacter sp. 2307UL18-2]|uniref:TlpA family protein disulfide reductase n=1 Tax=Maribacter sp. 2307UL18-2 TaxID=3386274 RepID=UPI0039BC3EE5